jgi:hypothetical protein
VEEVEGIGGDGGVRGSLIVAIPGSGWSFVRRLQLGEPGEVLVVAAQEVDGSGDVRAEGVEEVGAGAGGFEQVGEVGAVGVVVGELGRVAVRFGAHVAYLDDQVKLPAMGCLPGEEEGEGVEGLAVDIAEESDEQGTFRIAG